VTATASARAQVWGRVLNIAIVPLLMGFVLIVGVKVVEALH
jgi:hypothetical protein